MSVQATRESDRIGQRSEAERRKGGRRLALLKKAGLFGGDTKGAAVTRATGVEDLLAAYRLVHDAFVERGYIHRQNNGLRMRAFEALPSTATFVAKAEGEVVGVQSLAMDDPQLGLPSDGAFKAEIDAFRGDGRLVCEATNEAIAPDWRRTSVPTELMRCCFAHALAKGCTDLITTVSPGHARFYELLGFEQIGEVRSYSKEIEDPVVVVRFDLSALGAVLEDIEASQDEAEVFLKRYYVDENPHGGHVETWDIVAGRMFADATMLRVLFVNDSGLLPACTAVERQAIRRQWREGVFDAVWTADLLPEGSPAGAEGGKGGPTAISHRLMGQLKDYLQPGLSPEQLRELSQVIEDGIADAMAEETEACAKTVSRQLRSSGYHPEGLVGAVRERRHGARAAMHGNASSTWRGTTG